MTKTLAEFMTDYKASITDDDWVMAKTAAQLKGTVFDAIGIRYDASEDLLKAEDDEVSTTSSEYVKLVTITIPNTPPIFSSTLRIKFDLKVDAYPWTALGYIYRNGVAVGTHQVTTETDWVTKSQDIAGWGNEDTIELWLKRTDAGTAYAQNFRIYGLASMVHASVPPPW